MPAAHTHVLRRAMEHAELGRALVRVAKGRLLLAPLRRSAPRARPRSLCRRGHGSACARPRCACRARRRLPPSALGLRASHRPGRSLLRRLPAIAPAPTPRAGGARRAPPRSGLAGQRSRQHTRRARCGQRGRAAGRRGQACPRCWLRAIAVAGVARRGNAARAPGCEQREQREHGDHRDAALPSHAPARRRCGHGPSRPPRSCGTVAGKSSNPTWKRDAADTQGEGRHEAVHALVRRGCALAKRQDAARQQAAAHYKPAWGRRGRGGARAARHAAGRGGAAAAAGRGDGAPEQAAAKPQGAGGMRRARRRRRAGA